MTIVPPAASTNAVPYVFISYTRRDSYDRYLAILIEEALRVRKVRVFRDQSSIGVGAVWPDELAKALAEATHFVVILSAESQKPGWVNHEIDAALRRPREELRIIGIRRSTSAEFPQLAHIQMESPDVGQELETVFDALGLPWMEDNRIPTSSLLRNSRPHSRLEAELCDRETAEAAFRVAYLDYLRTHPSTAQAHFIVGREDEQHGNLVERLTWTYLEAEAKALTESGDAPVHVVTIDWPQRWTRARTRAALIANVFDTFFPRYSRDPKAALTPAAFAQKSAELPPSVVALVHTISLKRWDKGTPALLNEYLRFWREAGACGGRRLFFLFFNIQVCHPQRDPEKDEPACTKCEPVYEAIGRIESASLRPKARGIPATLLTLHCVRRADVLKWFQARENELFEYLDEVSEKLFAKGDCSPMVHVEEELRAVQTAYIRETKAS